MRETLFDYCMRTDSTYLLDQWDTARNGTLTPRLISYGSKRRVWWRCEKGHVWESSVTARTASNSGCPYCAGTRAIPGKTDLKTLYPSLAAQWHPTKNRPLSPDAVQPGSHRKVWWLCQEGHEWRAQVKSRVRGSGCPVCAGKQVVSGTNDLQSLFPDLARQWHPTQNGLLRPEDVPAGSHQKVWWRCGKGHVWQAQVAARTAGSGCPVCAGKQIVPGENDLGSLFPEIARQWHPVKNGRLTAQQVSPCSNRKVWWTCDLGHDYQAVIAARTARGSGCPYCSGRRVLPGFNDLATLEPELAKQWHPTLNGGWTPEMVTASSHRKVWWMCALGHVWKAVVYSRTGPKRCGCPVCAGKTRTSPHRRYAAAAEHNL